MKIEKVNEHQIRCTLTREDLADRELKLSELAYGTEKAKSLFRDMMQQASYEFGFEAEDIPLMIEAIPLNSECIVLIITKVEDPEELDTRFSKFAPSVHNEEEDFDDILDSITEGSEDVLDLFKRFHQSKAQGDEIEELPKETQTSLSKNKANETLPNNNTENTLPQNITKLYLFHSLNDITRLARVVIRYYNASNSLYKRTRDSKYILLMTKGSHSPAEFNKVCNIMSEYGIGEKYLSASGAYLEEHHNPIIKDQALQVLSSL